jgi:ADP-dependent phosphofructokinase/glucokinase
VAAKRRKYFTLINPEGKRVRVTNAREFAAKNNISVHSIWSLATGRKFMIKGFQSIKAPNAKRLIKRMNTEIVNLKTGERIKVGRSVPKLAKKIGVEFTKLAKLINKKYNLSLRGWVLAETYDLLY